MEKLVVYFRKGGAQSIVADRGRYGGREAVHCRRKRFGNAWRDHGEAGLLGLCDA